MDRLGIHSEIKLDHYSCFDANIYISGFAEHYSGLCISFYCGDYADMFFLFETNST